jgi:radical SAM superfamily enzyme YgiQ (UPF0313 family)
MLVGRRCDDNLNLGLDYLLAALDDAGIPARVRVLNRWQEMEPICAEVRTSQPLVTGLSLSDGGSSFLPLGLGEMLHRSGYSGHITCGGQFATLARHWLLERYRWLDSVVRFAGETPLKALVRCIRANGDFRGVPGLTSRDGDGAPADLLDPTPLSTVPHRGELPELLGHAMAHVAATRGCRGRCAYCGPAALLSQERHEARCRGVDPEVIKAKGIGGVKRRGLDQVCDEMARLWHDRDVRYFYFVDEHLLPYEEGAALSFLRRWRAGLARRGMTRWGIGTMLRVDRISGRVARSFARAGLVRAFLGIEFGTEREGRLFGRRTDLGRVPGLLRAFHDCGVATVSNLMLLHPYSTVGSIRAGLGLLGRLPTSLGLFEVNQMMVYHGTRLHERLQREGRLLGNPLRYSYSFEESAVTRFAGLFWRLRAEALRDYSVVFRSHDAALVLALARRLRPDLRASLRKPRERLEAICGRVQTLYLRALCRALDLAVSSAGDGGADELVEEIGAEVRALVDELEDLSDQVAAVTGSSCRVFSPMRAAAATVLGFVLAGGVGLAGCGQRAVPMDTGVTERLDSGAETDARICTDEEALQQKRALAQRVLDNVPCFYGSLKVPEGSGPTTATSPTFYEYLSYCQDPATELELKNRADEAVKAAVGAEVGCIRGEYVSVEGGLRDQQLKLSKVLRDTCATGELLLNDLYGAMIVLDENGQVSDVVVRPGEEAPGPEALACIKKALSGLTFPCLAGFKLCPEFVIVE